MIENIYEELKRLGAVANKTEFSEAWLGMDGSYFRGRRVRLREPSIRALATCAARLKTRAIILSTSSYPPVKAAAGQFAELAERCLDSLLAKCDEGGGQNA